MNNLNIETVQSQLVIDSRLISKELGIDHKNFLETIRRHKETIETAFGELRRENYIAKTPTGGTREYFSHYWLNEDQVKFLVSKSRYGLTVESINKFKDIGWDFSSYVDGERPRSKKRESDYCNTLAKRLNGKREVPTLAGHIDVLTSSQIIEVKSANSWKHALGQILVYSFYYPSHKKRIHLFGETQESFLELVREHCSRFDVEVTWQL